MRFQKSNNTTTIESVLRECKVGEVITYAQLTKAIGVDIRDNGRGALTTARRVLLRDEQIVFGTITNVGLRRLADNEIIATTDSDASRVRRIAQFGLSKLASVKFENLPRDDQQKHIVSSAQLGAIRHFTKIKTVNRIARSVVSTEHLQVGETLKMFLDNGEAE